MFVTSFLVVIESTTIFIVGSSIKLNNNCVCFFQTSVKIFQCSNLFQCKTSYCSLKYYINMFLFKLLLLFIPLNDVLLGLTCATGAG